VLPARPERLTSLTLTSLLLTCLLLLTALLAERLPSGLLARLLLAERLPGLLPGSCHANELLQTRLDIALAVMRPVRDALHEIVDIDRRVEVGRADLRKLVEDLITDLSPVRPQQLLDLLGLLLLHVITSPRKERHGNAPPGLTARSTLGVQLPPNRRSPPGAD
jgi:hypothetical protein